MMDQIFNAVFVVVNATGVAHELQRALKEPGTKQTYKHASTVPSSRYVTDRTLLTNNKYNAFPRTEYD